MTIKKTDRVSNDIQHFSGSAVVIGCSSTQLCEHPYHTNVDEFFSIDVNASIIPDLAADIANLSAEQIAPLRSRFKFTLLEHLPFTAYNNSVHGSPKGLQGFSNMLYITSYDGFIVIIGNPRIQAYRRSIYEQSLKYIESDRNKDIVIIPKNQQATIDEVIQQLKINQTTSGLYSPSIVSNFDNLKFCDLSFDSLPLMQSPNTRLTDIWYSDKVNQSSYQRALNHLFKHIAGARSHGEHLISIGASEKGNVLFKLANDLYHDLETFNQLPVKNRCDAFFQFRTSLSEKLHRDDALLGTHREYWKILIANILIALTGIGAALLAKHYVENRSLFFAKTKSREAISSTHQALQQFLF